MKIAQPANDIKGDTIEAKVGVLRKCFTHEKSYVERNIEERTIKLLDVPIDLPEQEIQTFTEKRFSTTIESLWGLPQNISNHNRQIITTDNNREGNNPRARPNTTARDLNDFVKHVKGKTCYIPTNPTTDDMQSFTRNPKTRSINTEHNFINCDKKPSREHFLRNKGNKRLTETGLNTSNATASTNSTGTFRYRYLAGAISPVTRYPIKEPPRPNNNVKQQKMD
ncbi:hypothetical protein C1646_751389 [Rhizophagus diaphanus]|nr:hypothetical protein C1646_751389 [Rhizophagus diaphanus] [Rhizophagus sp. MUCL 43196]